MERGIWMLINMCKFSVISFCWSFFITSQQGILCVRGSTAALLTAGRVWASLSSNLDSLCTCTSLGRDCSLRCL